MSKATIALAEILEYAKVHRDLADSKGDFQRWQHVAELAFTGLGNPSLADVARIIAHGLVDGVNEKS